MPIPEVWRFTKSNGEEVLISEAEGISVTTRRGIGLVEPTVEQEELSEDGVALTYGRYTRRDIGLGLLIQGRSPGEAEDKLRQLIEDLALVRQAGLLNIGVLTWERWNDETRHICAALERGTMMNSDENTGPFSWESNLQFVAPRPFYYSDELMDSATIGAGGAGLGFPLQFPIQHSDDGPQVNMEIEYRGSAPTRSLSLDITGPTANFQIIHDESGRKVRIGTTIPDGERMLIVMGGSGIRANRFVVEQQSSGANLIEHVNTDMSPIELSPGTNTLILSHDSGSAKVIARYVEEFRT